MKSIFKYTKNTRPLLPNSYHFIRSDVPKIITPSEIEWLIKENITTVVDLRQADERADTACPLENDSRFNYHHMPVTGGNILPESAEQVPLSYISMVDNQMKRIIETILEANSNVLYFCTAGKDRTGVVSALILHKMGMDSEYIINDYIRSKDNLKDLFRLLSLNNPKMNVDILIPRREYMETFLKYIYDNNFM